MNNEDILKTNKEKNIARLTAINSRLGIGRSMPRTVEELTALVGHNPLIKTVEIPAVVDAEPA